MMDDVMISIAGIWAVALTIVSGIFIHIGWKEEGKGYCIILGLMGLGMILFAFVLFDIITKLRTIETLLR